MELKPGYKQTEIGVIPEDWDLIKIIETGVLLKGRGIKKDDVQKTGLPCIRYGEIYTSYDYYVKDVISRISFETAKSSQPIRYGDIIFASSGETKEDIGKCIAYLYNESGYAGGDTIVLRLYKDDPLFIGFLFNHYVVNRQKACIGQGDAVVHLYLKDLSNVLVPIPSFEEQKKISSCVFDIDSLITSLKKLIEKNKLIKQGVMQELLTGKRRLPGFSGEWETKRYGDIFQFLNTANYTREDLTDTGSIKYIHYGDIHTKFENYVDLADDSIPTIQDCKLKNYPLLESGDIIMVDASEDYSGVGKSVEVINPNGCKAICGLHTILLRDTYKIFADGYRAFIHSIPSVKAQLDFYATGMKVYSISKNNLARIEIPVPPKDEQEAIVNTLGRFVDEIKALEVRLAKSILLKQAMMQELLTGRIRSV